MSELSSSELSRGDLFHAFIMSYLDKHVKRRFCGVHREWFRLVDDRRLVIAAPRGLAKAQSLDSKVLTPEGWEYLRDIHKGDRIIGKDGKPHFVLDETPVSKMDLYRVTTRDGRSTLCNLDHLWEVTIPSNTGNRTRVEALRNIVKNYKTDRFDKRSGASYTEYRYFLDWSKPIEYSEKRLPIDPYTLGAWLGDGDTGGGSLTTDDEEITSFLPYKVRKRDAKFRYGILGLHKDLRLAGFLGNKHIPDEYLYGSIEQRTRLLQGLMDTDGTVEVGGHIASFCNTNKGLIDSFIILVRSLGATVHLGHGVTKLNGKEFEYWKAQCRFPDSIIPFRMSRKRKKWKKSIKTKSAIVDIKFEKRDFGKCLSVEGDFYITDDFLVTHNSTIWSFFYVLFCVLVEGKQVALVSSGFRLAERFMGMVVRELEENVGLLRDFGERKGDKWTDNWIKLSNGGELQAIGADGRIRGMRPDVLIVDDIENDENVRSEDYRRKLKSRFQKSWAFTLKPNGQIVVVGTILHPMSLLSDMLGADEFRGYTKRKYAMLVNDGGEADLNGRSIWEEQWSTAALYQERDDCLEAFEQERQNNPIPDEMRKFSEADVIYYDRLPQVASYVMTIDPAVDTEIRNDYTAFIVLATDENGVMYVVEAYRKRMEPGEVVDKLFQLYGLYKPHTIGIEDVAVSKLYRKYFELEARRQGIFPNIQPMKLDMSRSGRSKYYRIEALRPFFKQGRIRMSKDHLDLKGELLSFPTGKYDDLCDALALSLQIERPARAVEAKLIPGSCGEFWFNKKHNKKEVRFHQWVLQRHQRII